MEKYQELKTLGRGSFGEAVLVKRREDEQLFVLKKIQTGSDVPEKDRLAAEKEMAVLEKLQHVHVVRYLEGFTAHDGAMACIVMEYCPQGCLQDLLNHHKAVQDGKPTTGMPQAEALDILVQILLGLEHCHARKVLHRDLKPANIFLADNNKVKIGDFGIARQLSTRTNMAETVVGTPYYLSPEVCEGVAYDTKSDVWSLGCMFHEMLSLERAFPGTNLPMIVMAIVQGRRSPLPASQEAEGLEVLDTMLQLKPADRPDIATLLKLPLIQKAQGKLEERLRAGQPLPASTVNGIKLSIDTDTEYPQPPWTASATDDPDTYLAGTPGKAPPWGLRGTGCFCWGRTSRQPVLDLAALDHIGKDVRVAHLAFGRSHKVAVLDSGAVVSWHYAGDRAGVAAGQLGRLDSSSRTPLPIAGPLAGVKVAALACGDLHTLAVALGAVYSWGDGANGQLGLGEDVELAREPAQVKGALVNARVVGVAAGEQHSVALTAAGSVLTWGDNERGQLGLGPDAEPEAWEPQLVPMPEPCQGEGEGDGDLRVVAIGAGKDFTGALAVLWAEDPDPEDCPHMNVLAQIDGELRRVLTWGSNDRGQLGRPNGDEQGSTPGVVKSLVSKRENVQQLSCGAAHVACLAESGHVHMWGAEECMQALKPRAGTPKAAAGPAGDAHLPRKVDWSQVKEWSVERVRSVTCGEDMTVVLTEDGKVFTWGVGGEGRLGHGGDAEPDLRMPKLVAGELLNHQVAAVACSPSGAGHVAALVQGFSGEFTAYHSASPKS